MKNSKKNKTGSGAESTCANSLEQNRSLRSSSCVNESRYKVTGGASCSYIQRHRLFGPGLLHLVVHDGVVDPQPAKDDESLRRDQQAGAVRGVPRRRGGRSKVKKNTSKRRWSASSKGFPSSLFSTWATPVNKVRTQ